MPILGRFTAETGVHVSSIPGGRMGKNVIIGTIRAVLSTIRTASSSEKVEQSVAGLPFYLNQVALGNTSWVVWPSSTFSTTVLFMKPLSKFSAKLVMF